MYIHIAQLSLQYIYPITQLKCTSGTYTNVVFFLKFSLNQFKEDIVVLQDKRFEKYFLWKNTTEE